MISFGYPKWFKNADNLMLKSFKNKHIRCLIIDSLHLFICHGEVRGKMMSGNVIVDINQCSSIPLSISCILDVVVV